MVSSILVTDSEVGIEYPPKLSINEFPLIIQRKLYLDIFSLVTKKLEHDL